MNKQPHHSHSNAAPAWIKTVLLAAAVYNLVWGTWVILRPNDLFQWTGIQPPLYPSIWQCVGMIVGVYGIGYAIAAFAPFRHWPIVLVGFLGKTLGPIGMVYNAVALPDSDPTKLPLSWGWVNLTNDLIWWPFFAAILYLAFKTWNAPTVTEELTTPDQPTLETLNRTLRSQHGQSLAELSKNSNALVVFLRHSGCTFCKEALSDIRQQQETLERSGTKIALVHMGENESAETYFDQYGLANIDRFSDPSCELYRAYELQRGKILQLFGPSVWWPGFVAAIINRHGVGKLGGDGFQMPGAFLIRDGKIIKAYRHETAASRPNYCELAIDSTVSQ